MKIKIGVSARHIHLNDEDLAYLFGEGYQLTFLKDLSQGIDFASNETLTIKTAKSQFNNVRILGPIRDYTQIEISQTDAYFLGINPPVRDSGDIVGSAPITLINGDKQLEKSEGCIIAARHIHTSPDEALQYGLADDQVVKFRIFGEKGGILDNVHIKVRDKDEMELHLDLDDANAHLVKPGDEGELIINE